MDGDSFRTTNGWSVWRRDHNDLQERSSWIMGFMVIGGFDAIWLGKDTFDLGIQWAGAAMYWS